MGSGQVFKSGSSTFVKNGVKEVSPVDFHSFVARIHISKSEKLGYVHIPIPILKELNLKNKDKVEIAIRKAEKSVQKEYTITLPKSVLDACIRKFESSDL